MLRSWPLVLLTAGVLALAACGDAQEVMPSVQPSETPEGGGSPTAQAAQWTGVVGVVLDSATSQPIAGATVEVTPLGISTLTGKDGRFGFDKIDWASVPRDDEVNWESATSSSFNRDSLGRVTITVTASGYASWRAKDLYVYPGGPTSIEARLGDEPIIEDFTCLPEVIAVVKPVCQGTTTPEP